MIRETSFSAVLRMATTAYGKGEINEAGAILANLSLEMGCRLPPKGWAFRPYREGAFTTIYYVREGNLVSVMTTPSSRGQARPYMVCEREKQGHFWRPAEGFGRYETARAAMAAADRRKAG